MNKEVWKPVVGFYGLYEVSDSGQVRAIFDNWNGRYKSGRILKQLNHTHGYKCVNLYYPDSKQRGVTRTVHSLVLEAFSGPRPPRNDARHLDGNKTNNSSINLKWGTRKENMEDSIRHGTTTTGQKCHFSKLTADTVRSIRFLFDSGTLCSEIAKRFGISIPQAWRIGARKSWVRLPNV